MNAIDSLEALRAACEKPVLALIQSRSGAEGEALRVPCRPISPALALELDLVLTESRPPNRKGRPEDPDQWDFEDPEYKRKRAGLEHAVRCLTVWHCCALFDSLRAQQPALNRDGICALINQQLPDDNVLRQLCAQINAGVSLAERVNFT